MRVNFIAQIFDDNRHVMCEKYKWGLLSRYKYRQVYVELKFNEKKDKDRNHN